jgi:cytoskeletal protein CcmA (bactofilin family)
MHSNVMSIGQSVVMKGELTAREDLVVAGRVEGKIELPDHVLTIGETGHIVAEIFAKTVLVRGTVKGNLVASEKVEIREGGRVEGDITAPRIAIVEGAIFCGRVDMPRPPKPAAQQGTGGKPAAKAEPAAALAV